MALDINESLSYVLYKTNMSAVQQGVLLLSESKPGEGLYITQIDTVFNEAINLSYLQIAWDTVIHRHDILRAHLINKNTNEQQLAIESKADCLIELIDLTRTAKHLQKKLFTQMTHSDRKKGFDIYKAPLMHLKLYQFNEKHFILVWTHHHVILAGPSTLLILEEVFRLYNAKLMRTSAKLNAQLSYKKYDDILNQFDKASALRYWKNALSNFNTPTHVNLPQSQYHKKSYQKSFIDKISRSENIQLINFAKQEKISVNTLILGAWGLLLSKYAGESDVVFGTTRSLPQELVEKISGLSINTLPIRAKTERHQSISHYLKTIRYQQDKIREFIYSSLIDIQKVSDIKKGYSLFETLVDYKPLGHNEYFKKLGDFWKNKQMRYRTGGHYPLILEAYGESEELYFRLYYDIKHYDSFYMRTLLKHFKKLLLSFIDPINKTLNDLTYLSSSEIKSLLYDVNHTHLSYPKEKTIHQLFEEWALKTPHRIAISYGTESLSYIQLNQHANKLARYLMRQGLKSDDRIIVCAEHNLEMIIAVLAVLKAGASYIPIDPAYPDERIEYMAKDSKAQLIITQPHLKKRINLFLKIKLIAFNIDNPIYDEEQPQNLPSTANAQSLAYIIYTSGSTGNPKGVCIGHQSLVNLIHWHKKTYLINSYTRASLIENFSFDAATWSIWSNLANGGSLHIADSSIRLNPKKLMLWLCENHITHSFLPTPLAEAILSQKWPKFHSLRYLLTGGDVLHYLGNHKHFKLYNHYGPTENTVVATQGRCIQKKAQPDIGKPIANTQIYILDHDQKPVPLGVTGEIYIGGDGLAKGYLNREDLTKKNFIDVAIADMPLKKLYRTGDLAQWFPNGKLNFIGRKDDQIKIQGYRIGLHEVESHILKYKTLKECTVLANLNSHQENYLIGYLVSKKNLTIDSNDLRKYLGKFLPAYMIPAVFIQLKKLPITHNGKIDKEALLAQAIQPAHYVKEASKKEKIVAEIWSQVLNINLNSIHRESNFFELGGDSILSFQVASYLNERGYNLSAQQLFECPVLAEFSLILDQQQEKKQKEIKNNEVFYTPIQQWLLNNYKNYINHFYQVCTVKSIKPLDNNLLKKSFEGLMAHHDMLSKDKVFYEYHHDTLTIRIRHDVVDGVSWHIILNDLENYYTQLEKNTLPQLSPKTTSFQHWAYKLQEYAKKPEVKKQLSYWLKQTENTPILPIIHSKEIKYINVMGAIVSYQTELSQKETQQLLTQIHHVYNTQIMDILISALAISVESSLLIDIEEHGREYLENGLNLTRTVGWFTSIKPIKFILSNKNDLPEVIHAIKSQLRDIPMKGLGYGLLKYLSDDKTIQSALNKMKTPDISFNYLGQFKKPRNSLFNFTKNPISLEADSLMPREHLVDIIAYITSGKLNIIWQYNEKLHPKNTIKNVATLFTENLRKIINHCLMVRHKNYLPKEQLKEIYPLSPLQKGLIFHDLYEPDSENYYVQHITTIVGNLNEKNLKKAWAHIFKQYDILRTGFIYQHGEEPSQFVLNHVSLLWQSFDWRHFSPQYIEKKLNAFLHIDRQVKFKLDKPPLFRLCFIKLGEQRYKLILTFHHIILDGWSAAAIYHKAFLIYKALQKGERIKVNASIPYKDFIYWLMEQNKEKARDYWTNRLNNFDTPTHLTIEELSLTKHTSKKIIQRMLSPSLSEKLIQFAKHHHFTLNTIIQGAWALLLIRYSGEADIIFGMTTSGRSAKFPDIEHIIGLTINTVPFRVTLNKENNIIDYLYNIQNQVINNHEHDYLPLSDIERVSAIPATQHLFETMYIFENYPLPETISLPVNIIDAEVVERTHYKLTAMVLTRSEIELRLNFDPDYYSEENISRMLSHWEALLEKFTQLPEQMLSTVSVLTRYEENQILRNWNIASTPLLYSPSLIELFEKQAETYPKNIALQFNDIELTYQCLNEQSNKLAHYLRSKAISYEDIVVVCLDRSEKIPISLLSILKAGAAYLPLDPDFPILRIEFTLNDAKPKIFITTQSIYKKLAGLLQNYNIQVILLDQDEKEINKADPKNPGLNYTPNQLAYVLYTSGSTGNPKGVAIEQKSLLNLLYSMGDTLSFSSKETVLLLTTFTFDIFGVELYLPLIHGAKIIFADHESQRDSERLIDLIYKNKISFMQATPVTFEMLLNHGFHNILEKSKIKIICCGEALTKDLAKGLLDADVLLWNGYGPTETTIYSGIYPVNTIDKKTITIPIGKSVLNTALYVFDPDLNLLPVNIIGELYIGGEGLARGYLNRSDLTQEKFITHPFDANKKLYRTGDLARWLPDGNLEYMGRIDHQTKIHGFRIELPEIEFYLNSYPNIKQCIVISDGEKSIQKKLIAYLVLKNNQKDLSEKELNGYLRQYIPHYMIPNYYILLNELPLTATQKIDKKLLPKIEGLNKTLSHQHLLAQTSEEKKLVQLLARILKTDVDRISMSDNFFDIGGDSISAIISISSIKNEFNTTISIRTLLEASSLTELLSKINAQKNNLLLISATSKKDITGSLICLQTEGTQPPLFFIHPIGGTVFLYYPLAKFLGKNQPIYAIQDPGIEAEEPLYSTLEEMASAYIQLIKQKQSSGPYYILGASFGANVSIEIARQLIKQGDIIAFVGLIDGWAIYPAKANTDREWFEKNLTRQHQFVNKLLSPNFTLPETLLALNWHRQQLVANHRLNTLNFKITLFKSAILLPVLASIETPHNYWDQYAKLPVDTYIVPGDHETMLLEPNVQELAKKIKSCLPAIKN